MVICTRGVTGSRARWSDRLIGSSEALTEADRSIRARALQCLGVFQQWQGDLHAAQPLLEESLALFRELGDTAGFADVLGDYGMLFVIRGDHEQAGIYLNESMVLWRELGDMSGIALTLLFLGNLAYLQGLIARAGALWEESLVMCRAEDNRWLMSIAAYSCRYGGNRSGGLPSAQVRN